MRTGTSSEEHFFNSISGLSSSSKDLLVTRPRRALRTSLNLEMMSGIFWCTAVLGGELLYEKVSFSLGSCYNFIIGNKWFKYLASEQDDLLPSGHASIVFLIVKAAL